MLVNFFMFSSSYDASDADELTFNEGDVMVLVQEGKSFYIFN